MSPAACYEKLDRKPFTGPAYQKEQTITGPTYLKEPLRSYALIKTENLPAS